MELSILWTIARKEFRGALRNRWLWFYAVGFAALAFALSQAGLTSAGYSGLGGFGRTAASLINAVLLFVPLIGLSVGAATIAADRERGTLLYLMAQPVNRAEIFWGKALGAALAVIAALGLGFAIAGAGLLSVDRNNTAAYLSLVGYTLLLALVSLGLGLIIGACNRKSATASGAALLLWLGLVFGSDLGLIGAAVSMRPAPATLFGMLVANPLQIFKLSAIYSLHTSLDVLGPVGQYASYTFGSSLSLLLTGLLVLWGAATSAIAFGLFNRRGDL